MLKLAIEAGLPLIRVITDDTLNVESILIQLAGSKVTGVANNNVSDIGSMKVYKSGSVFFVLNPSSKVDWFKAYHDCVTSDRTLVVINPEEPSTLFFDAGVVQLPKEMLFEFLSAVNDDEEMVQLLMPVLGGMTLKEVAEVCRMCEAEYGTLSPRGVTNIRRLFMVSMRGVQQCNTNYAFYKPKKILESWVNHDGRIFKLDVIPELIPRGLLFDGPPGTGKTMGAKYVSNMLEVPLFRLDLGATMDKYVGESERNLSMALAQVDETEPCILLIDEVEKAFKATDDTGVTSRLLSQLLWWLQEHKTRVLTIMTTNDIDSLPEELIRPGRIDEIITFVGLLKKEGVQFCVEMAAGFKELGLVESDFKTHIAIQYEHLDPDGPNSITQSKLTQLMYDLGKVKVLAKLQ